MNTTFYDEKMPKEGSQYIVKEKKMMAKYIVEDMETSSDESYLDDSDKENCGK